LATEIQGEGRGTREEEKGILNGVFWRAVGLWVERGKWAEAVAVQGGETVQRLGKILTTRPRL
jgi:hypothetical protein